MIVVDRDLRITAWSRAATELLGLREDEAIGEHLLDLDIGLPVRPAADAGARRALGGRGVGRARAQRAQPPRPADRRDGDLRAAARARGRRRGRDRPARRREPRANGRGARRSPGSPRRARRRACTPRAPARASPRRGARPPARRSASARCGGAARRSSRSSVTGRPDEQEAGRPLRHGVVGRLVPVRHERQAARARPLERRQAHAQQLPAVRAGRTRSAAPAPRRPACSSLSQSGGRPRGSS